MAATAGQAVVASRLRRDRASRLPFGIEFNKAPQPASIPPAERLPARVVLVFDCAEGQPPELFTPPVF